MPPKCDHCGTEDEDANVEWVHNPYIADVHNELVWEWMCTKCYEDACDDI